MPIFSLTDRQIHSLIHKPYPQHAKSLEIYSVQGVGIRGEIIVRERRLELKHDATEVELTSTVRFF